MGLLSNIGAGISAVTSGIGGIMSPIITGIFNAKQAQKDRDWQTEENATNRTFNRTEAKKDRDFQEEMRDTSFISAVNQVKQLGISPSLLLGDQSNQLGGSRASASGSGGSKASLSGVGNPLSGVTETINKILDQQHQRELAEDRQAHARELAEDRQNYQEKRDQKIFEHQKELAKIYNSNSSTSKQAQKHNYTKKDYDNMYTDISKVEI